MKKYIVVMLFSFLMASCGQETEKIHLAHIAVTRHVTP